MSRYLARLAAALQAVLGVDLAALRALARRWRPLQPRHRRALDKRELEAALRAEGLSKSQAVRVVARVSTVLESCDAAADRGQ